MNRKHVLYYYETLPDFGKVMLDMFRAKVMGDLLEEGAEAARRKVNEKVSRATEGKIRDILPLGNMRKIFIV